MWLSDPQNTALFYMSRWYCFDNFSAFTVEWRGKVYPTAEHAYQSAKFANSDDIPFGEGIARQNIADLIRNAKSAHDAKQMGNLPMWQSCIRKDWDVIKLQVMEEILRAKYDQHEYVRSKLEESQKMMIVEDSSEDAFWGRGSNWKGQNHLGRLWMKIRDEKHPSPL